MSTSLHRVGIAAAAVLSVASATLTSGLGTASVPAPAATTATEEAAPPVTQWPADIVPTLDWAPCHDRFECATAEVPRDYDDPYGVKIQLAMIRYPAADTENRIGSLFMNPGGPGGSGLGFLIGAPQEAFDLFPRFDVVSWDTRGVGASTPAVDCSTDAEDDAGVGGYYLRPGEVDHEEAIRDAEIAAATCLERNPEILPYISTANVARDLDVMRAAVGDRQLTYLGISHGAHIGATYATLFPGRARALLLDSPVDMNVWANHPAESDREQNASFEDVLDRFFTQCALQPEDCGFGGSDPEAAFDVLVAEMNANPVPAPNSTFHEPVTGDEVLDVATSAMYSPFSWESLATALNDAAAGDASLMRDLASAYSGRFDDGSWTPSGVFKGTRYQDGVYPADPAPYFAEDVHAYVLTPHLFAYAMNHTDLVYSPELNPTPKNDAFRGPWSNSARAQTALVIAGTYDPATPYRWAERYVHELGNAQLLTYQSTGHGAITDLNGCIIGATIAYLEHLELPAEGATCTQEVDPFLAGTEGATADLAQTAPWVNEAPYQAAGLDGLG